MSRPFNPMTLPLAGVQLIEASAGTGKTYSITSLYLRLLLTRRLGVEQVLVVTFTEAATAELRERVRARLQAAINAFATGNPEGDLVVAALLTASREHDADLLLLRQALAGIDEAAITTIHGFCHRMLQRGAFESGIPFDFELVGQIEPLLLEMLHDFLANLSYNKEFRLVAIFHEAFSERDLLKLVREAVRHREFPVALPPAMECGQLLAQAQAAFATARKLWQADRAAISASCMPAMFLKELGDKIHNGLLERLADYLAGAEPPAYTPPAGSELLTPDAFSGKSRKSVCPAKALKNNEVPRHPFFAEWQRYVEAVAALREGFLAATLRELIDYARAELPRRLYRDQAQSFDDLLHGLDRALAGPGGPALAALIRASYPVALIDEFQDTNPVQYRIFQTIYGGTTDDNTGLFLIGDPKQAIYAFRGADVFAYLRAAGDAGEQRHTMTTNWRADDALVDAVNRLFEGIAEPFLDQRITFSPVSGAHPAKRWQGQGRWQAPFQFLALPADGANRSSTAVEAMMPRLVAGDIVSLLGSETRIAGRKLRSADIAVLVNENAQASEMQQALHRHGVAAVLHSRASVFASHEARELLLLLWAVAEPSEAVRLRSALVTDYLGLTAEALVRLDSDDADFQEWLERFGRWHLLWRDHGFMRFMGQFSEEGGVAARLVRYDDGQRRLTNLRHLTELLHAYEARTSCRPLALCTWLAEQCRGDVSGEEAELRLESDADAVQLVTIHRSKGLEYPVVYCPYLWKGRSDRTAQPRFLTYHDPAAEWAGRLALFPAAGLQALQRREAFAEALRLLYVAVTRAKHCCVIPWAGASTYHTSALAYLLHGRELPNDDLDELASRLKVFSQAELLEQLGQRVAQEKGWGLRLFDPGVQVRPLMGAAGEAMALCCPTPAAHHDRFWRIGSFSGLIARAKPTRPEAIHDYDEAAAAVPDVEAGLLGEVLLADFPKGATAGTFFHRLLELADFQIKAPDELAILVAGQLRAFGFATERWQSPVCAAVQQMLAAPLVYDPAIALRDVTPALRLHELPFLFPVRPGGAGEALRPQALARALAVEAEASLADYANQLAALDFLPMAGYLKGFVDLVFMCQDRWYVVDYKSNHLGRCYHDYGQAALARAMADHHYFLQYHLYSVALDRYLRLRLPGYCYEQHFGGVAYLFLKGMHPDLPGNGVFFDRPPASRLKALGDLFLAAR